MILFFIVFGMIGFLAVSFWVGFSIIEKWNGFKTAIRKISVQFFVVVIYGIFIQVIIKPFSINEFNFEEYLKFIFYLLIASVFLLPTGWFFIIYARYGPGEFTKRITKLF